MIKTIILWGSLSFVAVVFFIVYLLTDWKEEEEEDKYKLRKNNFPP
jgi:hypothetical protein